MVSKELLKGIIVSNEEYILNKITGIVPRIDIHIPDKLNKVVVFYGVRRSGKTFILYNLFRKYKDNALYVDFEDERISEFASEDFEILKEAFLELKPDLAGEKIVFLLDEVQNIKGWEKFVRRIAERENARVFVTGSSSKMMPEEIHTSLRGRSWSIEVTPFSFREILVFKNIDIDERTILYGKKKNMIRGYFSEYLKWGGFPEVLFLKSEFEKKRVIKEYLDAMFFKDLVERFNITNTQLLSLLMETLFSAFASKLSLTSFYKQYKQKLPFSKDMLFLYYKFLLESMLVFEVRKFSESSYKRMRNPAKIYVADVSICKKVVSENLGRVLENIVFLELRKIGHEIFYFEEEKECDFISRDFNGSFIPYQVTQELTKENEERELKGMALACKQLSISNGTILTDGQEGNKKFEGINIKIFPVWKWLCVNK